MHQINVVNIKRYKTDKQQYVLNGPRPSVEELSAIVALIAEKYGVNKVYIFGSVARGGYNENSDYDFCI